MLRYTMQTIKDTYSYQPQLTDKFRAEFINQYNELNKLPIKEWLVVGKAVLYLQGLIPYLNEMEIWIVGRHQQTMREWFYENSDKWICEDDIDSDDDDEMFLPVSYKTSIEEINITVNVISYSRITDYYEDNGFNLYLSIFSYLKRLNSYERKALMIKGSIMIHNYFSKWCYVDSIHKDTFGDTYKEITVYNPPSLQYLALVKFLLDPVIYERFHYLYSELEDGLPNDADVLERDL